MCAYFSSYIKVILFPLPFAVLIKMHRAAQKPETRSIRLIDFCSTFFFSTFSALIFSRCQTTLSIVVVHLCLAVMFVPKLRGGRNSLGILNQFLGEHIQGMMNGCWPFNSFRVVVEKKLRQRTCYILLCNKFYDPSNAIPTKLLYSLAPTHVFADCFHVHF